MCWFANLFASHRYLVGISIIVFTAFAISSNLNPRAERWTKQRDTNEAIEFYREVAEQFHAGTDPLVLVIQGEDLLTPEAIAQWRETLSTVESWPEVQTILEPDKIQSFSPLGGAQTVVPEDPSQSVNLRERVLEHPLLGGQMLSPDGRTLVATIIPHSQNFRNQREGVRGFQAKVAELDAASPLAISTTGGLPLRVDEREASDNDVKRFTYVSYVLCVGLAALLFRGIVAVIIVAGAPALGLFWTWGVLNFLGFEPDGLTGIILPVLISMIGLADGVHLMVDIRTMRASGVSPLEASRHSIEHLGMACLLTSLTTAIGFGSLALADAQAVREFGQACAIGVVVTFYAVVTVIPLLCSTWLGRNIDRGHERDLIGRGLNRCDGLLNWIIAHARGVTITGIASTFLLGLSGLLLEPEVRRAVEVPAESQAYQTLREVDDAIGGLQYVHVVVDWPEGVTQQSPELFSAITAVHKALQTDSLVRHPLGVRNLLAVLPQGADNPEAAFSLVGLLPSEIRDRFFRPDLGRTIVSARVADLGIAKYEPHFVDLEEQLHLLGDQFEGYQFRLTGELVSYGRHLQRIIFEVALSLCVAAIIIFAVMGVAYRSLRIGLICIVPTLFPLSVTAALLWIFQGTMQIATVCAFTICLGIAVDDTIHFLSRFRRELAVDGDVRGAVKRSFIAVGTAMIMTSVIMLAGFGTVLTSEVPAHQNFAAVACSTIATALIADLFILPAMLVYFIRRPEDANIVVAAETPAEEPAPLTAAAAT